MVRHKFIVWVSALMVAAMAAGAAASDFSTEAEPAPPQVPLKIFNLMDFGAVPDGKTYNTEALRKAVAAVAAAEGGHLEIPAGTYLTMPFSLTSHMDFHLEEGAVIQFPADLAAYKLPASPTSQQADEVQKNMLGLMGGHDLTDVSITGSGAIDGGGSAWWTLLTRDRPHTAYGNARPKLVVFTNCQRVLVQGVTVRNSPMYQIFPRLCKDVVIEGVHVFAPPRAPNTDAIDPMGCDNVVIRECDLDTGDDNVAIKAIEGPCTNILVANCRCKHGHGISIGSETYKGIHDVTVRDCSFEGTTNGIRIKSARDRGNDLYNFSFSNLTMKDVGTAISLNMYYMDRTGIRERVGRPVTPSTPTLHNVRFNNVTVVGAQTAGEIIGLPESVVKDVTWSHVTIAAAKGITVRDAQGIVFDHVSVSALNGHTLSSEYSSIKWGD